MSDYSKLQLIINPLDKRLYERCKPVKNPNSPKIFGIVQKMKEIQKACGLVGLAANQVGVNLRIITAYHEGIDEVFEFINPRIIAESCSNDNISWDTEGCASHPGILADVARYSKLQLIAHTLKHTGEVRFEVSGMLCRIIQHEICHLNGILITDMGKYVRNIITVPEGQIKLFEENVKYEQEGQKDFTVD